MNVNFVNIGEEKFFNTTNINFLIRFNTKREIFNSFTKVLRILLTAAAVSASVQKTHFKGYVDYWLETCVRKTKVPVSSPAASNA